ncbi:SH3 domain-containing protein [Streptomyces montanus]|uniref:SH3 domain-containing protein n=1 Tax=Streptomyces montanus TaxID=2580423 RepID=A0A5R9F9G5_9ACTN|nr:SH3 domain-containing protein [Streptomyces montanus]TLS39701.1 SH3 domain-containing protein [Streptomyces montanus]
MSPRSALIRLGITAAAGALALGATSPALANGPALADGPDPVSVPDTTAYQGVVTAVGGLLLRNAPTRGSAVVRTAAQGEIVQIYCKQPGETVDGNPLWYLLADGTWAWGAARYINNIGPSPRWC